MIGEVGYQAESQCGQEQQGWHRQQHDGPGPGWGLRLRPRLARDDRLSRRARLGPVAARMAALVPITVTAKTTSTTGSRGPGRGPQKVLSDRGGKGGQVGEGQGAQHDQAGGDGQRRALPARVGRPPVSRRCRCSTPSARNSAALVSPSPTARSATPPSAAVRSSEKPSRYRPIWATTTKANSRLRWRLHERHGRADQGGEYPEAHPGSSGCGARPVRLGCPEKTVSQVRASPKRPSSLRTPAKSTQAGAGAVP